MVTIEKLFVLTHCPGLVNPPRVPSLTHTRSESLRSGSLIGSKDLSFQVLLSSDVSNLRSINYTFYDIDQQTF